jgi:O-antigen ligase
MAGFSLAKGFDRAGLARIADALVVTIAVSLPWSTSVTAILLVLWLIIELPTLDWADVRRAVMTPAGWLPVLLVALGLVGMMWADVPFAQRVRGFDSFPRLLIIPLLFVQFARPGRGERVFLGYLLSCIALLVATTVIKPIGPLWELLTRYEVGEIVGHNDVLVKNAATQSGEFVTCISGLLYLLYEAYARRHWKMSLGLAVVICAMLASILYVSTGRTSLVVLLVLLVLFAVKKLKGKSIILAFLGAILIGAIGWFSSPYLRERTTQIWTEIKTYEATNERTSSGERIEFWKKSVEFVRQAPVFGHGTGTIRALFEKAATGKTGAAGVAAANPHGQTFAIAIQLGLVGAAILWAMWIAHMLLFRGDGLAEWIGLVIVIQNVVGSLFNSHLFDFTQGWLYVVGVGVAGGMVLKNRRLATSGKAE